MKVRRSIDWCTVLFEEGEKYAGQEVHMRGGMLSWKKPFFGKRKLGFRIEEHTLEWAEHLENNILRLHPIEEALQDEITDYIIAQGKKQKYKFKRILRYTPIKEKTR